MRRNPVITVALATISFLLGDSLFANTLVSNNANVEVQGAWKGVAEDLSWEIVRYPDGFFFERKIVAYDFAKPAIAFFRLGKLVYPRQRIFTFLLGQYSDRDACYSQGNVRIPNRKCIGSNIFIFRKGGPSF
jgi:hypothetical protein